MYCTMLIAAFLFEDIYFVMLTEAVINMVLLNIFRKRNVATAHFCDSIKKYFILD